MDRRTKRTIFCNWTNLSRIALCLVILLIFGQSFTESTTKVLHGFKLKTKQKIEFFRNNYIHLLPKADETLIFKLRGAQLAVKLGF